MILSPTINVFGTVYLISVEFLDFGSICTFTVELGLTIMFGCRNVLKRNFKLRGNTFKITNMFY